MIACLCGGLMELTIAGAASLVTPILCAVLRRFHIL